jgi:hypothetical protein
MTEREWVKFYSLARRLKNNKISRGAFIVEWGLLRKDMGYEAPVKNRRGKYARDTF